MVFIRNEKMSNKLSGGVHLDHLFCPWVIHLQFFHLPRPLVELQSVKPRASFNIHCLFISNVRGLRPDFVYLYSLYVIYFVYRKPVLLFRMLFSVLLYPPLIVKLMTIFQAFRQVE